MRYKRVLLKLSGEALLGPDESHTSLYDQTTMDHIASEIKSTREKDVEVAVVLGGGNIFRGVTGESRGMKRVAADHFGMLATIQNGLVLHDLLERNRVESRLMTGLAVNSVAEPYIEKRARSHLKKGRVILLVGGTGNPFCTTDYAAALRASEIEAQLVAKATNIDGVYDKDPRKNPDAKLLKNVSYSRCLRDEIKVMDAEAFALCKDQKIPIRVFSLKEKGNISAALSGADIGSLVSDISDSDPPASSG